MQLLAHIGKMSAKTLKHRTCLSADSLTTTIKYSTKAEILECLHKAKRDLYRTKSGMMVSHQGIKLHEMLSTMFFKVSIICTNKVPNRLILDRKESIVINSGSQEHHREKEGTSFIHQLIPSFLITEGTTLVRATMSAGRGDT